MFFHTRLVACGLGVCALAVTSTPVDASPDPEAGLPFITAYSPRDYRGHAQVWSAAEDAAGVLYFGNLNQVLVYDGARWSKVAVPDATFLRGLAVDANDTLWIGGVDELGYATTSATGGRTFVSLKDRVPADARDFGAIWRVVARPEGVVFHAANALLSWDGTAFTVRSLRGLARHVLVPVGEELWLTNTRHDWQRLRHSANATSGSPPPWEPLPEPDTLSGTRIMGAVPAAGSPGFILATEKRGLSFWDGATFAPFAAAIDASFQTEAIYGMAALPAGRIGLHTLQRGLLILDENGQLDLTLNDQTGLPSSTVICVFATRDERSLWLGTANGVVHVDLRPWLSHFDSLNGAPAAKLEEPVRLHDTLYVAAENFGLLRLAPGTGSTAGRFVPERSVDELVNSATPLGETLMLSTTHGLREWDGETLAPPVPGSPTNAIAFMPLSARPGTWAALDGDAVRLYHRDAEGWSTPGPVEGLSRVRSLIEDDDGSWWSGRPTGGVLHTTFADDHTAHVTTLTAPDALPAGHGWTRLIRDARGLLLGCELGLFRFNAATTRFEPCADYGPELADGTLSIRAFSTDAQGGLWIVVEDRAGPLGGDASALPQLVYGHDGQLTRLRIPGLAQIDDPTHLHYEPANAAGRPETLWIGALDAMIRLNLDLWRTTEPDAPRPPMWRKITTGAGLDLPLTGGWSLPYDDRSVHVQFASVDLAGDTAALYETTLQTSSGPIRRVAPLAERDFTALAAGDYTLHVRVRPTGGAWSVPARIAFTVLPPWWMSPIALAGYVTSLVFVLVLAWRARIKQLVGRQRALETAVADRTAALAAQNAELERLHQIEFDEKLVARLAAEKASLEVLRYQLNPHFLFNTLNAVCAQIIKSPRTARDTVVRLAEFCRLTLHRPDGNAETSLAQEIEMLRAYLDIEQTRLGDLLDIEITVDPALTALKLPPFLLLPLVENAVKYGSATSRDHVSIRLTFFTTPDGDTRIEITNSGHWIDPKIPAHDLPSLGLGLENVRQRLARYFPDRHEFKIGPATDEQGVTALLILRPSSSTRDPR